MGLERRLAGLLDERDRLSAAYEAACLKASTRLNGGDWEFGSRAHNVDTAIERALIDGFAQVSDIPDDVLERAGVVIRLRVKRALRRAAA
jgi:hypothetical protein